MVRRPTQISRARSRRRVSNSVFDRPEAWSPISATGASSAGVVVNHRSTLGYPPLWRAVNLIADAVAMVNLYLHERHENDRPKAYGHPAYRLMAKAPSPFVDSGTFKHTLMLHAQLDGNGYAWVERNGHGDPVALWILDPSTTYPVVEVTGLGHRLFYLTRDSSGTERKLGAHDVLHIKGPSYDGYMGLNVIDVMRQALGLGIAARQFSTLFFEQGLNAKGFIMVPGKLSPDELNRLREQWPKIEAGLRRAHLPVVLHGGMDWKPNQVNPDDAQAIETRQFEVREVANITGVPARYLGDNSATSYNSLEMESQEFLTKSVDPWLRRWEQQCDAKLLSDDMPLPAPFYFEFQRDDLIRVNRKELAEITHWERQDGIVSVNDVLRRKNQPIIGPEGDVRHVPMNWSILTDKILEEPGEKSGPTEPPEDDGGNADDQRESAIVAMAEHRAGILIRSECDQVCRAAKREANFIAWAEKYYASHKAKVAGEASLLMDVCLSSGSPEDIAEAYAASRLSELLAAADGDPAGFVDRVESLCETWKSEQVAGLARNMMGADNGNAD